MAIDLHEQTEQEQADEIQGMLNEIGHDAHKAAELLRNAFKRIDSLPPAERERRQRLLAEMVRGFTALNCTIKQDGTGWGFRVESLEGGPVEYSYCITNDVVSYQHSADQAIQVRNHAGRGSNHTFEAMLPKKGVPAITTVDSRKFRLASAEAQEETAANQRQAHARDKKDFDLRAAEARTGLTGFLTSIGLSSAPKEPDTTIRPVYGTENLYVDAKRELERLGACMHDYSVAVAHFCKDNNIQTELPKRADQPQEAEEQLA